MKKNRLGSLGCSISFVVAKVLAACLLLAGGDVAGAGRDVPADATYLIVTTETIRNASLQMGVFTHRKRARFGTCEIVTEADWGGGEGDAAAENLRAWLVANVPTMHTRYILLVGDPRPDVGDVPMKVIRPGPAASHTPVPTDMYYSALAFAWTDFLADDPGRTLANGIEDTVRVGRIPVYSLADIGHLDAILERTMAHERAFGWQAWRRTVLAAGAVVAHGNYAGSGRPGIYGCDLTQALDRQFRPEFSPWSVVILNEADDFSSTLEPPRIMPGDYPLTAADLRSAWSDGTPGIVVVIADGNQDGCHRRIWRADPDGDLVPDAAEVDEAPLLDAAQISRLSDVRAPIVVQLTSHAAAPGHPDNFANLLLRRAAVAVVAPTAGLEFLGNRDGEWGPESYGLYIPLGLATGELPGTSGIPFAATSLGAALSWCRARAAAGPTAPTMNLFGDPSLRIEYDTGGDLFADDFALEMNNLGRSGGTVQATLRMNCLSSWIPTQEFTVRFYLSEDDVIDPAADTLLGGDLLRLGMRGEETRIETVDIPVPAADPFGGGAYYLGVVVDAGSEIAEVFEDNNANQGLGIDIVPVYYHATTAGIPFREDWEAPAAPEAWWEVQSAGGTGRTRVTDEYNPAAGRHMVLDSSANGWPPVTNRLILHQRMHDGFAIVNQAVLTFHATRFSAFDALEVDTSMDGGTTWTPLLGTADFPVGETVFQAAPINISAATGRAWEDILIRFTHTGAARAPHGGVAIDNVRVGPPGPEVIGRSFALTPGNLSSAGGRIEVDFSFASLIDLPAGHACVVYFFLSEDAVIDPDTDLPLNLHPDDAHAGMGYGANAIFYSSTNIYTAAGVVADTAILASPLADPFGSGNRYYVGMVLEVPGQTEVDPDNNSGLGVGIDMAEATFVTIAGYPFAETWESGAPSASWEFRSTAGGRIAVSHDHDPANGDWHVVLDSEGARAEAPLNQLILHINLAGQTGVQLSYLNREWDDADDLDDKISISVDGGHTWRLVTLLLGRASDRRYTRRIHDLDALGLAYGSETLIRFQQRANGRMAFDDIRVTPETIGPKVTNFAPTGRRLEGVAVFDVWFDEPMDTNSAQPADVAMLRGPDGSDLRGRVNLCMWDGTQRLRIFLNPPLEQAGGYAFALAPTVTDLVGNDLDNDGDGTPGETPGDIFAATFSLAAVLFEGKTESPHPGWQLDPHAGGGAGWQFGVPIGGIGQGGGPDSGYDGPTVLGYNLAGTYYPSMPAEHATTPPINATGYGDLAVSFWRWLVVESSSFDRAAVASSGNGIDWTDIWSNPETLLIDDQWEYQFLPLDPSCVGSSSVRVRWAMGPTNPNGQYEGWYIDNIQVTGIPAATALPDLAISDSSGTPGDRRIVFPPTPLGAGEAVATFTVANHGGAKLAIAGIHLRDDAAGEFSLVWDGDGVAPAEIAPGLSRTCTVRFLPVDEGTDRRATIRIISNDPTPGEGDTEVVCLASTREEVLYAWTRVVSADGRQVVEDVVFDAAGNVLVAGTFAGTVDFDPDGAGRIIASKNGSADAFVAKFSSLGKLLWLWTPVGSQDDAALGLGIDPLNTINGAVLVVGEFRGAIDFDPASGRGGSTFDAAGGADAFAVMLDENGNFKWAWTGGGPGYDSARAGLTHTSGTAYVTGVFSETANFDPMHPSPWTSNGGTDIFVCPLSMMGMGALYGVPAVIGGTGDDIPHDLAVDRTTSSVMVVGEFRGTVDFNPLRGLPGFDLDMHSAVGGADAFLWCLNSSLGYNWTRTWGSGLDDRATGVACNAVSEQVLVAGEFRDTIDFAPELRDTANTWSTHGGGSMADVFVLALGWRGTFGGMDVDWSHAFGASTSEHVGEVAVLGTGDVVVVGDFSMAMDADPGEAETVIVPVGNADGFVVRLSQFGTTVDAFNVGSLLDDAIVCVAADTVNAGGFAYGGHYRGRSDFNPNLGAEDIRENAGAEDGFVSRLASREPSATTTGVAGVAWQDDDGDGIRIAGEPFAAGTTLFMDDNENGVRDAGERAATTDVDGYYEFTDLPPARYRLTIELGDEWRISRPAGGDHFRILELRAGGFMDDQDFAFYRHASIAGRVRRRFTDGIYEPLAGWTVFLDSNGNGQHDLDEPAATTGADGGYSFPWLIAGAYSVRPVFPNNFAGGPWRANEPATGQRLVVAAPGEHLDDIDFTAYPYNIFSGTVWQDSNADGVLDPGEPGLAGMTVFNDWRSNSRLDADEEFAISDANGHYELVVEAGGGSLDIRFTVPETYGVSCPNNLAYLDGDRRNVQAQREDGYLVRSNDPGSSWGGLNVGFYTYGTIAGVVFVDLNRDGVRDPGEPGMPCEVGIDGLRTLILTRSDGTFETGPQPPGRHDLAAFPPETHRAMPEYHTVEVAAAGTTELDIPLQQEQYTIVRGKVWLDSNGDGIQDAGECPLPDIELFYFWIRPDSEADFFLSSVRTNREGDYEIFVVLPPWPDALVSVRACFSIYEDFADGAVISPIDVGDDSVDSDYETTDLVDRGRRFRAQLQPWSPVIDEVREMDLGIHLPAYGTAEIRVWEDSNGNGLEDDYEPGVPGVEVTLYRAYNPHSIVPPRPVAVTGADGIAHFSGLMLEPKRVGIVAPPDRHVSRVERPRGYADINNDAFFLRPDPRVGEGVAFFNEALRLTDGVGEFDIALTPPLGPADFGDASFDTGGDPPFAGHIIRTGMSLGAAVDAEEAGRPSNNSDGDDTHGIDDEDGVTFDPAVRVARRLLAGVTVNLPAGVSYAYLNVWSIQYRAWGSEAHLVRDLRLRRGVHTVPLHIPEYEPGTVGNLRFRLSTIPGVWRNGLAADGEVEDYAVSYVASGPPDPALIMGIVILEILSRGNDNVVVEAFDNPLFAGQPFARADGVPTDDAGHYAFSLQLPPHATYYLRAFVDANGNGQYDPGEQILLVDDVQGVAVADGDYTGIVLSVPFAVSTVQLRKGWNFVALSTQPLLPPVGEVFHAANAAGAPRSRRAAPLHRGPVWRWLPQAQCYAACAEMAFCQAVWVYLDEEIALQIPGGALRRTTVDLGTGWNAVGAPAQFQIPGDDPRLDATGWRWDGASQTFVPTSVMPIDTGCWLKTKESFLLETLP